ncbi:MAG: hypothetical protein H7Z39_15455 [Burkholderiaceae bacterium]|nr:hypothetical protein [Burkholderiaceae bacterium]
MPYNLGMNQVTLVLPFALPAPELVADLIRAMQAPALAALLTRTSAQQFFDFDNSTRVLPHEAWLAHALGLGPAPARVEAGVGFAAAAMRGFGLDPADGVWFLVHPVHVQISRNHLLMGDPRQLALDDAESRALFDAAKPYFDEIGKPLLYGDAHTWFARADDWAALRCASPDAATSQNLNAWMPEGPCALATRKLQNEVQMLWFNHPVNEARQARGAAPVNFFWLWGGAQASPTPAATLSGAAGAGPTLFTSEVPAWLAALAEPSRRAASAPLVLASNADDALVVLGGLAGAGLNSDWSVWLMHLQMLEREWFAPLLAALKDGRVGSVRLVLNHRDAYAEFTSTRGAQRKFWRKPTLNKLIK